MKKIGERRCGWIVVRIFLVMSFCVFCAGAWPGYLFHTYKTTGELTAVVEWTQWLSAEDVVRQHFVPQGSWLSKIMVALSFNEDVVTDEYLIFGIEDDRGNKFFDNEVYFREIEDSKYFEISVEKKLDPRREYVWTLSLPEGTVMEYAVMCADNTAENKQLLIGSERMRINALNQYEYYAHYDKSVIIGGFWVGALLALLALLEFADWMEHRTKEKNG